MLARNTGDEEEAAAALERALSARVELRQRARLVEIARNLADRIDEARANGWLGEVRGLQVSFEAARKKLVSLDRLARNNNRIGTVNLGMPIING